MKLRFWDRLLSALEGLLLIATGLVFFLWAAKGIPASWLEVLTAKEVNRILFFSALGAGALLTLLGVHSLSILFRRKRKKGFVVQKTEHGELSISIHAMENLVQKCIDKHQELTLVSNRIANTRDGVVVDLRIGLANGVSIPLVVSTLQKQIKQYITSCSGIDVKEVKVEVETANLKSESGPYTVPETLIQGGAKPVEQNSPKPAPQQPASQSQYQPAPPAPQYQQPVQPQYQPPVQQPAPQQVKSTPPPAPQAKPEPKPEPRREVPAPQAQLHPNQKERQQVYKVPADLKGPVFANPSKEGAEKKRPLHQRLFGHKEQPAIVPVPPEMTKKAEIHGLKEDPIVRKEEPAAMDEAAGTREESTHEEH